MDIACPTCATTYEIDDGTVAETGRKVRCAECATVWRVFQGGRFEVISAPAPEPLPPPDEPVQPQAMDPPPMAPTEADVAATAELPAPSGDIAPVETVPADTAHAAAPEEQTPQPRGKAKITSGGKAKASRSGGLGNIFKPKVLVTICAVALLAGAFVTRQQVVRLVPQTAVVFAALGVPVNLRGIDIRDVKSRMVEDNGVNVLVIDGNLVNTRDSQAHVPRLRFAVLGDRGQEIYVWSAQADRSQLKPGETLNFRRRLAAPPADGRDVSVRFLSASDITAGLR
jgi:predicted Zn finger-like uncharacterized protein